MTDVSQIGPGQDDDFITMQNNSFMSPEGDSLGGQSGWAGETAPSVRW